ncbi:MAG: thiopeptide-type bacteriocin biosynthesis protein [Rhodococcus sp. (in: high G+C Gram-positive bacteria)]
MIEPEWIYHRIYCDHTDAGTAAITGVIGPAVTAARSHDPELDWFYLRFVDQTGFHLRFRWSSGPTTIDAVESAVDAVIAASSRTALVAEHNRGVYRPEVEKFGGRPGIDLAHRMFRASSDYTMATEHTAPAVRAAAHMMAVAELLPERARTSFWSQYAWYWSGGPVGRTPPADLPGERAVAFAERARSARNEALQQYVQELRTVLSGPDRPRVARTDYYLLFHQIHLTNNRLGVFPAAEARIARLLWRDRRSREMRPHPDVDGPSNGHDK